MSEQFDRPRRKRNRAKGTNPHVFYFSTHDAAAAEIEALATERALSEAIREIVDLGLAARRAIVQAQSAA